MFQSVYGINAARLHGLTTTLQRLQDDPEALQHALRRFDSDDPPPPYSPTTVTEPPTPTLHAQLTAQDTDELVRRPLDNKEIHYLRESLHAYRPGYQFHVEFKKERARIGDESLERDSLGRRVYRGPDLIGRPGNQRLDIMARNSIRKRWEKLGVWNSKWGIPVTGLKIGENGNPNLWNWKWPGRRVRGDYHNQPFEVRMASWPPRDEEYPDERAVRQYLQRKGQWTEPFTASHSETTMATQENLYPHESFITSRPWYQWSLEVEEEDLKLARAGRDGETAAVNIRERWKANEDWKDSWDDSPGWKWRHESPSPEPEDPNEMDFSPSEIDALETIPPPTPHPPLYFPPPSNEPDPIFGTFSLEQHNSNQPASVPPNNDPQRNDENKADRKEAVDDRQDRGRSQISNTIAAPTGHRSATSSPARQDQRKSRKSAPMRCVGFVPGEPPSPAQNPLPSAPRTRSLRKCKRDEERNSSTRESSQSGPDMHPKSRQQKRPHTTRSTSQLPQQPARSSALNGAIVHGQLQRHTTREQLLSGPRRSARIAQLQKAREEQSVHGVKVALSLKRKDNTAPRASQPCKRSKRPKPPA